MRSLQLLMPLSKAIWSFENSLVSLSDWSVSFLIWSVVWLSLSAMAFPLETTSRLVAYRVAIADLAVASRMLV